MNVSYLAMDDAGREVTGTLDAADRSAAATALRARGLYPLELREARAGAAAPAFGGWRPRFVTSGDQVQFLSQLALMLGSGLTLFQALEVLAATGGTRALRGAAARLSKAVQIGTSFSAALEQDGAFPPLVSHLVRSGEATGELELVLTRAADYIERRAALVYQLLSAMAYPGIVVVGASGVFWFMTTQVVPKFAAFLAGRGRALPPTTQALMDLSAFLVDHGATVVYALLALLGAIALVLRSERARQVADRVMLRIPGLALILRTSAMAHLGHTLGMLLRSGLPLLESLRVLAGTFRNRGYRAVIDGAAARVVQGESLAQSLKHPTVTPLCLHLISVGESTGALDGVLDRVGAFYEGRLQRLLRLLSGLVEPVVLVIVGCMVGFVYVSFFQALFSLAR